MTRMAIILKNHKPSNDEQKHKKERREKKIKELKKNLSLILKAVETFTIFTLVVITLYNSLYLGTTGDFSRVTYLATKTNGFANLVVTESWGFSIAFGTICIVAFKFTHSKLFDIIATIGILIALAIIFIVPSDVVQYYINFVYDFASRLPVETPAAVIGLVLLSKIGRKIVFRLCKISVELFIVSTSIYLALTNRLDMVLAGLQGYFLEFATSFRQVIPFTNRIAVGFIGAIFFFQYMSGIKSSIFHVKRKRNPLPTLIVEEDPSILLNSKTEQPNHVFAGDFIPASKLVSSIETAISIEEKTQEVTLEQQVSRKVSKEDYKCPIKVKVVPKNTTDEEYNKYINEITRSMRKANSKAKEINKDYPYAVLAKELPAIDLNMPAHNEEDSIIMSVDSALAVVYPGKLYINVIDDGSTDKTAELVIKEYKMYPLFRFKATYENKKIITKPVLSIWVSKIHPNLRLICKVNGKKHDALNVALLFSHPDTTGLLNVDADTQLTRDSVTCLALEMVRSNANAVTGCIIPRIPEGSPISEKSLLMWQTFDYLSSFHVSRGSLSLTDSILIVSGAFGLFDKFALLAVNGYKESLGEDMHLTLEIQERFANVVYVPEALAYTVAPHTLDLLAKQRARWFKGLIESLIGFKRLGLSRLGLAYAEFFMVELATPILIPYGLISVVLRPATLVDPLFWGLIGACIFTSVFQCILAAIIEKQYRSFSMKNFIYLPLQIIMPIFTVFWRNKGWLDLNNKDWGFLTKKV